MVPNPRRFGADTGGPSRSLQFMPKVSPSVPQEMYTRPVSSYRARGGNIGLAHRTSRRPRRDLLGSKGSGNSQEPFAWLRDLRVAVVGDTLKPSLGLRVRFGWALSRNAFDEAGHPQGSKADAMLALVPDASLITLRVMQLRNGDLVRCI